MDFKDKRIWIGVAVVALLVILIWFNAARFNIDEWMSLEGREASLAVSQLKGATFLSCSDSDSGKNYAKQSTITFTATKPTSICSLTPTRTYKDTHATITCQGKTKASIKFTEYCKDKNTLTETYCVGKTPNYVNYKCPKGCLNGVCKK